MTARDAVRQPIPLPIDPVLPDLLDRMRREQAVVLVAPPGAGKTTRVPPALLGAGTLVRGQVVLLQPRRMAARAVARRMAEERGEPLGRTVGYRVRFEDCTSAETRILVVTEGILTRRLLADPLLEGVGCVILDEFHERSVHSDLCLAFLRETARARDDLRLLLMSATLEAGPLQRFLGDCPLVSCELPERIAVPSGSRIRVDYLPAAEPGGKPVLAVKLQELFGLRQTPRLARGHVALLVHLLAPSGRPVQVTQDLESFWATGYAEVRKTLRGRYPRHPWPEDPHTAQPTARTVKRR
jgi:HrpA-like RNA helicase